ncbi:hypothetical protein TCAL_14695 [Tigriopus californicus]|uniref:G-protein coupled receptors family 1 profile domain-containing protein n=1 Tax=Tigriopus californicus TaxID=6832 RepID=A0A553NNT6_TIGCA|nr:hypothetical protein TCAL_14695 [Tigriopus californicus]
MPRELRHIDTGNHAGWHIPCYGNSNCPKRLQTGDTSMRSSDSALVPQLSAGPSISNVMGVSSDEMESTFPNVFLSVIILLSLVLIIVVAAVLCSNRQYRKPLNFSLFSALLAEVFMVVVVLPLHIIHTSLNEDYNPLGSTGCTLWMGAHLMLICVKSWTWPSLIMLHFIHDGQIPLIKMGIVLGWVWLGSFLLSIPPVISFGSLLDIESCAMIPRYSAMMIYVCVILFILPSLILTPFFLRWSRVKSKKYNEARVDPEFRPVIITLSIVHAILQAPSFLLMLIAPILIEEVPLSVFKATTWLSYCESLLVPLLIVFLMDQVKHTVYLYITCTCNERRSAAPSHSDLALKTTQTEDIELQPMRHPTS